jgi:hypothetical protein
VLLDSKHYLEIKIKNPELSKHPKKYRDKNTFIFLKNWIKRPD